MANTLPDVVLTGVEYQDLYTETGLTVGTALLIQNKSIRSAQIIISDTKPALTDKGFLLEADPRFPISIGAGEAGVWALGKGSIGVGDNT